MHVQLPCWPANQDEIKAAVLRAMASNAWNAYPNGAGSPADAPHPALIELLLDRFRVSTVRLVSSGTVAVELALKACLTAARDEVILAAFDYPGNLRSVTAVGATSVRVDIMPGGWSIDLNQVEEAITPKTCAILVSHLYQTMAQVVALREMADRAGIYLIEDACQAPGAEISLADGSLKPAGTVGHIGTLSFGGSKLLTAGSGGAVVTDDARLAQRLSVASERPSDTYPLSQLQAAALLPQLSSLDFWNEQRRKGAAWFTEQLTRLAEDARHEGHLVMPALCTADTAASLYKFAWFSKSDASRQSLLEKLGAIGIPCGKGFPAFSARSAKQFRNLSDLRVSKLAANTTVVMDHRVLIAESESQNQVIKAIRQFCETGP